MESGKLPNPLRDKSYKFALRTVGLYKYLAGEKREFVLSKQVLRAGTSIGANVVEASQAQSKADFTHKLSISLKEAFELSIGLSFFGTVNTSLKKRLSHLFPIAVNCRKF